MRLLEYLDNKVKRYLTDGESTCSARYVESKTGGAPLPGWLNRIGLLNIKKNQQPKIDVISNTVKLDDKVETKMDVDVSAEELLNNVKNFYLQHYFCFGENEKYQFLTELPNYQSNLI